MRSKHSLAEDDVAKMAAACQAEAKSNKWAVSIAIVDDSGHLMMAQRLDGAGLQTPDIALMKARTAALTRTPTAKLEQSAKDRPTTMAIGGRLPVQGGVPIFYEKECVGAIGVSGAQSQEDEQVANAGVASLGSS